MRLLRFGCRLLSLALCHSTLLMHRSRLSHGVCSLNIAELRGGLLHLQNAFKSYIRMRDYCATSKQIVTMCLDVIRTGFELGNHVHVNNYIQKAEQTPGVEV